MRTVVKAALTALTLTTTVAMTIPAGAGPVPGSLGTLSAAAPHAVTDVRWRGEGAVFAGVAAALITGAIIAGSTGPYYYGPGPYYYGPAYPAYYAGPAFYGPPAYYAAPPYYGPRPYYYYREPVYYAPPVYRAPRARCWIVTDGHRGYGYWGRC